MSTAADESALHERIPEYPDFELTHLLDDADDPTELTIFLPSEDDVTTHWITVDFEHAIPIAAVR